jgi:hypothetical protein
MDGHRRDSSPVEAQNGPMQTWIGDADADAYLAALVARAERILGPRLVGVYVVNSGGRGDYVPGSSDLDAAVVVADALDDTTKRDLIEAFRHRSLPCAAPRLELVVYRRDVVAAPGPRPAFEVNLNTGPAIADHVTTDPADELPHWFVLDLAAAAEQALRLVGPPSSEVFGLVPRSVALDALVALRQWHAQYDTAAPNRVLNDCRAWRFVETGTWSSKSEAAAWAMEREGDPELIRHAAELRIGSRTDPLDAKRVAALSARVGEAIEAARRASVQSQG